MRLALILWLALASLASPAFAQSGVYVPATTGTIAVAGTVAASTKIITGVSGKSTYITAINLIPSAATGSILLNAGTGTNCGTNTTALTGTMVFAAGQYLDVGTGYGALLVAPQGYDVCITIAAETAPGFIAYSQF